MVRSRLRRIPLFFLLALSAASCSKGPLTAGPLKTKNVLFVMSDGVRWEEMFRGAEAALMTKSLGGVVNPIALKREFDRPTPEARREALFPFTWKTLVPRGQLFGNRDKGSSVRVTNGKYFSYPGYSETLCGFADPRVNSNAKRPNPNRTVLEWLYHNPRFEGKVAAFAAWNVFPYIFNRERCGFYVNAGYEPMLEGEMTPKIEMLNTLKAQLPKYWDEEPFDAITFQTAVEYFRLHEPRIFYLSLGETDDWCHDGRYDQYLLAAHRADQYIETLWNMLQANPHFRDTTTLIVATDHGRGHGPVDWKGHGEKYPGSENIWIGVLGPDTPALGERANCASLTQTQLAATLARFLGEDYSTAVPKAGSPIHDVFPVDGRTAAISARQAPVGQ